MLLCFFFFGEGGGEGGFRSSEHTVVELKWHLLTGVMALCISTKYPLVIAELTKFSSYEPSPSRVSTAHEAFIL